MRPAPASSRSGDFLVAGLAPLLWLACFLAYSRNAHFPYQYHPDELGKADQVIQGRRNYRHPQLLLETTSLMTGLARTPADRQAVTEVGRRASAMFAATAVVVLALAAFRDGGTFAFLAVGASVGTCPQLLVNAHYFKEDAGLVLGLALVALASTAAGAARDDRSRRAAAAWLGAACAVAVSGKYVGQIAIAAALPMLRCLCREAKFDSSARELGVDAQAAPINVGATPAFRPGLLLESADRSSRVFPFTPGAKRSDAPDSERGTAIDAFRLFAIAFAAVIAIVNWRAFRNPGALAKAFGNQVVDGVVEHKGLTMRTPTPYFAQAVTREMTPFALILAGVAIAFVAVTWRRRTLGERLAAVAPVGWLALVSFSSAPNHRHALPAVVFAQFLGAMFVARIIRNAPRRWKIAVSIAFLMMVGIGQGRRCADVLAQFADDSRDAARAATALAFPPGSRVLQDAAVQLNLDDGRAPGPPATRPTAVPLRGVPGVELVTVGFAPEFCDFDDLRREGITHVVICELAYGRHLDPHVVPVAQFAGEHARRRAWYERIMREGELVWAATPAPPTYAPTNPPIRVYRVPAR